MNMKEYVIGFIFNLFRILCHQYKLYLFAGVVMVLLQLFSGYFLYMEASVKEENFPYVKSESDQYLNTDTYKKDPFTDIISNSLLEKKIPSSNSSDYLQKDIDNNDEDYGIDLPCHIESTEAISALQRTRTTKCKRIIANISCEIKKGTFYPHQLKSSCPSNGNLKGKYIGCFVDDRENRVLPGHMVQLQKNSPDICSDICFQRGFIYSGVEYSKECFCGNKDLPMDLLVPDSECNMSCVGNTSLAFKCGGFLRIGVFQTGIPKIEHKALKRPSLSDGPLIRIAYILTVNGRSLRQVHRLFKALYHVDHFIYIHVDARQNYLFRELLALEERFSNVLLSRKRFSSIWGGSSLLSVLLHSMEQLLAIHSWDFVINLSESDFPIKNNDALVKFLTANKERNFLKSHGHDTNKFLKKQGLDRTFLECENRMWRIGERKFPLGIRIDGGSDWVCLNRQFVEYIIQSDDALISGLKKIFEYTLLPGESFFHTLLRNSEFCQSFTDNNLHATNWKRKLGCRCQYKHIVDWCGCSPNDFTPIDVKKLEMSKAKNLFFARKFEPVISVDVINTVEEWLYGLYDTAMPNLRSHWDNRYHVLDPKSNSDDVAITFYRSAIRLSQPRHCQTLSSSLIQAYSLHHEDQLKGIIVEFKASDTLSNVTFQTFIQSKDLQNITSIGIDHHRLNKLEVNTHFDQKEQQFRNFERSLGPYSDLVLATYWESSDSEVDLTPNILLIDPVGAVAATAQINVDREAQVIDHAFTLQKPLRPGNWTAYVILNTELIASLSFAILPFEIYRGESVSSTDAKLLHSGPPSPYSSIDPNFVFSLPAHSHPFPGNPSLIKSAKEKTFFHGRSLQQWIDQLVQSSYIIKETCYESSKQLVDECIEKDLPLCSETSWSSFAPDPKTHLGNLDPETGRFKEAFRIS